MMVQAAEERLGRLRQYRDAMLETGSKGEKAAPREKRLPGTNRAEPPGCRPF